MCGILGVVDAPGRTIDVAEIQRSLDAIRHRGPDDEGFLFVDSARRVVRQCGGVDTDPTLSLPPARSAATESFNVAFGHRRLSILDLSTAGHQPMPSADQRRWMVFNGEIYNYVELRRELQQRGHHFVSGTDTEVILAAHAEWGAAMLPRFVGMFALAILDLDKREVLIARDAFGIKPFYYSTAGGRLAFASEMKALHQLRGVSRALNPESVFQFLRFGISDAGGESMFADIHSLPAAHCAVIAIDAPAVVRPARFWELRRDRSSALSFDDAVARTRELFDESVRLHMRSDVPVGSCLSGGLDSTALVLSARRLVPADTPFHTFSFLTDDPALSEEPYVDLVSRTASVVRHEVRPVAKELVRDLDALTAAQDVPFGGTSVYAQYRVFQLAGQAGIKVMLDGQGSDEIFGGYNTAVAAQMTSLLLKGRVLDATRLARSFGIVIPGYRRRMVLSSLGRILPLWAVGAFMTAIGESITPSWMDASWFAARGVAGRPRAQGRGRESLREELLHSIETVSLPQLLRYEDRNSMAFSIESRVPFCVPALAELALSLPSSYLVTPDGTTKAVFRAAMRGLVPDAIIDRPKVGFTTPERDWLRALVPWVRAQLTSPTIRELPFLNGPAIARLAEQELESRGYFGGTLWRLVNFVQWAGLNGVAERERYEGAA